MTMYGGSFNYGLKRRSRTQVSRVMPGKVPGTYFHMPSTILRGADLTRLGGAMPTRGVTPTRGGGLSLNWEEEARKAVEEAKAKQEASKAAALGYYQPIQSALAGISPELITPAQQTQMMTTRRAELGAYGQNLASLYTDPYSGVQAAQRTQIGMGIAGRQANLPIELQLEVERANREATLGLYGAQAGVAGGMAGVEMAYQYDPGLEYIKALGYGQGYQEAMPSYGTLGGYGGYGGAGRTTRAMSRAIPASQLGARSRYGYTRSAAMPSAGRALGAALTGRTTTSRKRPGSYVRSRLGYV